MLRKLFGGKRSASIVEATVAPQRQHDQPASPPPEVDPFEYLKDQVRWDLVQYGIPPEDSRIYSMTFAQVNEWFQEKRSTFIRSEVTWWDNNITRSDRMSISDCINRYALGGTPPYPYVSRPFDYSTYASYRELPIGTARMLIDRGLEVACDAESRHFLLMSGIKRESAFALSMEVASNRRLLSYAADLRYNRPEAEVLMLERWGKLPPSRGLEYDVMPFMIAQRRITFIYRQRNDDPTALDGALAECRDMISRTSEFKKMFKDLALPLPGHPGYTQLAIILDKQGHMEDAIEVSRQAQSEGWDGDWEKRIERYERKFKKQRGSVKK